MSQLRINAHGESEFLRWYDSDARREGELEAVHRVLTLIAQGEWQQLYYADDLAEPGRRIAYAFVDDLDHGVRLVLDIETADPGEFDLVAIQSMDRKQVDYLKRHHIGPPPT